MALGFEAGGLGDACYFFPQQGNAMRRTRVGNGSEEAEKQALADNPALAVEAFDRHRVHVHRPVHGRAPVGLGTTQ